MCLCCINGNGMAFEGCKRWVSRGGWQLRGKQKRSSYVYKIFNSVCDCQGCVQGASNLHVCSHATFMLLEQLLDGGDNVHSWARAYTHTHLRLPYVQEYLTSLLLHTLGTFKFGTTTSFIPHVIALHAWQTEMAGCAKTEADLQLHLFSYSTFLEWWERSLTKASNRVIGLDPTANHPESGADVDFLQLFLDDSTAIFLCFFRCRYVKLSGTSVVSRHRIFFFLSFSLSLVQQS